MFPSFIFQKGPQWEFSFLFIFILCYPIHHNIYNLHFNFNCSKIGFDETDLSTLPSQIDVTSR